MLVGRLGDMERKIASKTGHLLRELLKSHPQMKMVVVKEVGRRGRGEPVGPCLPRLPSPSHPAPLSIHCFHPDGAADVQTEHEAPRQVLRGVLP